MVVRGFRCNFDIGAPRLVRRLADEMDRAEGHAHPNPSLRENLPETGTVRRDNRQAPGRAPTRVKMKRPLVFLGFVFGVSVFVSSNPSQHCLPQLSSPSQTQINIVLSSRKAMTNPPSSWFLCRRRISANLPSRRCQTSGRALADPRLTTPSTFCCTNYLSHRWLRRRVAYRVACCWVCARSDMEEEGSAASTWISTIEIGLMTWRDR